MLLQIRHQQQHSPKNSAVQLSNSIGRRLWPSSQRSKSTSSDSESQYIVFTPHALCHLRASRLLAMCYNFHLYVFQLNTVYFYAKFQPVSLGFIQFRRYDTPYHNHKCNSSADYPHQHIHTLLLISEISKFTNAINDIAADGISGGFTPVQLTIQSNINFILFPVPGIFVCIYCSAINVVLG